MKLDFVAIAGHELRTPLTVVRGYLNLINNEAMDQLSVYNIENLQRALVGAEQLSGLINNLLNISRIERGQLEVVPTKVDMADITKQIVEQQQVTTKLKDQTLVYEGPNSGAFAAADVTAISEVLNNLITNALKYTASQSRIVVSLEAQAGGAVRVAVTDNGPGIALSAQKRLFTKFYRVEHDLTAANRGTGLGLYIAKTIIDLHHGTIGVISDTGKGASFFFTVPAYDALAHDHDNKHHGKEQVGKHGWIKKRSHN